MRHDIHATMPKRAGHDEHRTAVEDPTVAAAGVCTRRVCTHLTGAAVVDFGALKRDTLSRQRGRDGAGDGIVIVHRIERADAVDIEVGGGDRAYQLAGRVVAQNLSHHVLILGEDDDVPGLAAFGVLLVTVKVEIEIAIIVSEALG